MSFRKNKEVKWLEYSKVEDLIRDAIRDTPTKDGTADFVWDEIYTALDNIQRVARTHYMHRVRLDDVESRIYQAIDDTPKKRAPKGSSDPVWDRIYAALKEMEGDSVGRQGIEQRYTSKEVKTMYRELEKKKKEIESLRPRHRSRVGGVIGVRFMESWPYRFVAHEDPYQIQLMRGDKNLGALTFRKSGERLYPHKNTLVSAEKTPDGFAVNDDLDILDGMAAFASEVFPFQIGYGEFEIEKEEDFPEEGPLLDLRELLQQGKAEKGQRRHRTPKEARELGEIYPGKRARWVGVPGNVMKIDADLIMPTIHNKFSADQLAAYYKSVMNGDLLSTPTARVDIVSELDIEASILDYKDGNLSRPLRKKDIGKPFAVLTDGNHRAFAAILAGEPYVYVYVLPMGRNLVRDRLEGVAGKEWHESKEYFGGGEEATHQAAKKAIAENDLATLKRIMQSVNAAPDVILSIIRHDPVDYSWLMKQQPRLYELVQEEPRILGSLDNGVFDALVRFASGSGKLKDLLGKPTKVLRFSTLLASLRRGSSDAKEMAEVWPSFMEKFTCGALQYESESSDGVQLYQKMEDALDHILMEVECQSYFSKRMARFANALRTRRNQLQDIDASFLWEQFSIYADAEPAKVGASNKKVKGLLPSSVTGVRRETKTR